jgi:hypothetical protein
MHGHKRNNLFNWRKPLMKPRPFVLFVALLILHSSALAQQTAKPAPTPNKAAATPTATSLPANEPLNLTAEESQNIDKNQKAGTGFKDETALVQKHINEAASKILAAKTAEAMGLAGYQMRDALLEDQDLRGRIQSNQVELEKLVIAIRQRFQAQTGKDYSQYIVNLDTKQLVPPQATTATTGATGAPPGAPPK